MNNHTLKKAIKYIFYTLLAFVVGFMVFALVVFNSSTFQFWLTQKVTTYLSAQFKTKITIDRIRYFPMNGFSMSHVYWGDQKNDTLFFVEDLRFNLGGFSSENLKLTLNDVVVNGGYCKIVTYPDSTFNIDVLFNIFDPNDTIPDTISPPFTLYFNRVACHNSRFRLIDSTVEFESRGFDGFNEDFNQIELLARNFWIIEDSLHFDLKKLSCKERSGLELKQLTAITTIGPTEMRFDSLLLETPNSKITHSLQLLYASYDELADFNHSTKMVAHVEKARVDMRDLQYFADALIGNTQQFEVTGDATGTVDNIRFAKFDISFGKSVFSGSGSIKGLPELDETFLDIKAQQASTNKTDLERLITVDLPDELDKLGNMRFEGRYTGFLNDFVAYGSFKTNIGSGTSDLNMKLGNNETPPSYSGRLTLTDFNMGVLTNQPSIGKTSLVTTVNGKGFSLAELESSFETKVQYFVANNYRYKNITMGGALKHKMFKGKFDMNDDHAEVHFNGTIDLNQKTPLYKFKASIDYADLNALNFDTSQLVVSSDIDINFAFSSLDDNHGSILLNKTLFIKNGVDYPIESINLLAAVNGNQRQLSIHSDMLDASLSGAFNFKTLPAVIQHIFHNVMPDYIAEKQVNNLAPQQFIFEANISDIQILSKLFFPHLHLLNASMKGQFNSSKSIIELSGTIEQFQYNEFTLNNISIDHATNSNSASLSMQTSSIEYADTTWAMGLNLQTLIEKNEATTSLKTTDSTGILVSNIACKTTFENNNIHTGFSTSSFNLKNKSFTISQNGSIDYNSLTGKIVLHEIELTHLNERLVVNGFYNNQNNYNVSINLQNIGLSNVNLLYSKINYKTDGRANGKITVKGDGANTLVNAYLNLDDVVLDNDTLGNFTVTSNYDEKQQRLISYIKSLNGKLKDFEAGGYIDLRKAPYEVNYNVYFTESDLKSFQAFIKDDVTIFYGKVAAKCKVTGTINSLNVEGNINVNQVLARVEYLKTIYGLNARVQFNKDSITILPFNLVDINGKQAKVEGTISHQSFSRFMFDLNINDLNGFQLLNTTSNDNNLFYGKAYATGRMTLTGPQDNLMLEANLKSAKGTLFSIPLSDNADADGDALLNFVDKDTLVKSVNITDKSTLIGLGINMVVTVTPDAQIQLVFDESQDDKIIGTGKGTLRMELTKQGIFSMFGEVAIENGEYKFTAVDVFTRKFLLQKGGTITWTGDPFLARMNIQGIYKVRNTSVADILTAATQDQKEAVKQQRVPVECVLNLKGNLLSPDIGFDLNFPDNTALLGNNVSALENSLRILRNSPEQMQQQVVSLMLFGKFAPIQGGEDNSNSLNAGINNTLSDLISAQANNLLSRVIPGFDVSADYQTALNAKQTDKAIVTASKKFMNDRLEVQTSFDVLGFSGNNNFTGQIMGQYSLRPDGNLKLRGFNRTATNPLYNRNVTSQGIGLYYRREFDSFSDLLRKKQTPVPAPIN